jgi:glycosyltransferase involved in cell wall biosynthesis
MKWKEGCHHCPQKKTFPKSILFDRSKRNYRDKKEAFSSLGDKLTIVTVSEWLRDEMRSSFLGGCRFKVIHNGIDLNVFDATGSETSLAKGKKIILGVASIWLKEKGLDDFKKLAEQLDNNEVIVLIGKMSEQQRKSLPKSIITLERTSDIHELASLYRSAIAFVNPTRQDNYPTVNLEAIACGTPVITYRTGGSPESVVDGQTGFVVEQGDVEGILSALRKIESSDRKDWRDRCRTLALKEFGKTDRYSDYIALYESLTTR